MTLLTPHPGPLPVEGRGGLTGRSKIHTQSPFPPFRGEREPGVLTPATARPLSLDAIEVAGATAHRLTKWIGCAGHDRPRT